MKKVWMYLIITLSGLAVSCSVEVNAPYEDDLVSLSNFDDATVDDWIVGFAQYPAGLEDSFKLSYRIGDFVTFNSESKSLILRGKNLNNDLFMFVKGEISGFEPDTYYDVIVDVELSSILLETYEEIDQGSELSGSYLKVGAMTKEPKVDIMPAFENSTLLVAELDINIGIEYEGSLNIVNLGKLVYSEVGSEPVVLRGFNSDDPIRTKTNSEGKLWLLIGIDSNHPVYQDVYINFIGGRYRKVAS
ncbi:hypothetical protein ACFLU5_03635 [Bacteroidota bacterium]